MDIPQINSLGPIDELSAKRLRRKGVISIDGLPHRMTRRHLVLAGDINPFLISRHARLAAGHSESALLPPLQIGAELGLSLKS